MERLPLPPSNKLTQQAKAVSPHIYVDATGRAVIVEPAKPRVLLISLLSITSTLLVISVGVWFVFLRPVAPVLVSASAPVKTVTTASRCVPDYLFLVVEQVDDIFTININGHLLRVIYGSIGFFAEEESLPPKPTIGTGWAHIPLDRYTVQGNNTIHFLAQNTKPPQRGSVAQLLKNNKPIYNVSEYLKTVPDLGVFHDGTLSFTIEKCL